MLFAQDRTIQTKRKCKRVENYYTHIPYYQSQAGADIPRVGGGGAFNNG
jgi:hypothetical protein